MTIRDFQNDFSNTAASPSTSIIGAAGTYLAPNSIDMGPFGAFMTSLTPNDTQLSANTAIPGDLGGGEPMWLVIDWVIAPTGGTSVDMQLITSASSTLSSPVTMIDTTAVVIASLPKGTRQLYKLPRSANWLEWLGLQAVTVGTMTAGAFIGFLAKDVDSVVQGYASGFGIK